MKTSEVLKMARGLLAKPKGWFRYGWSDGQPLVQNPNSPRKFSGATCYCLDAAIHQSSNTIEEVWRAESVVAAKLPAEVKPTFFGRDSRTKIVRFNDASKRRKREVLQLLDDCIEEQMEIGN